MRPAGPPDVLLRSLVEGPSLVRGVEWHEEVGSTNAAALGAAARGAPEVHVVLADRQSAGRGRLGRRWVAPAGSNLLCSLLLRPAVAGDVLPLLPLLAGVALAEAVTPFAPGRVVALKWPNDLLIDGRKAAGVLVETGPGAVVVGIGLNVGWSPDGAARLGESVDRWRVFAALVAAVCDRYGVWRDMPAAFLDAYRARCATLGRTVRVTRVGAEPLEGVAETVRADGTLVVGGVPVLAGDVEHVRPA